MTIVSRSQALRRFDPERRIGAETSSLRIKPELQDDIGARVVARRLQHIVLKAGDVRHKAEAVRRIGRNRVRTNGRFVPVDRVRADCPVPFDRMHRHEPALVIGGEQVFAGAVRREKGRRVLR